MNHLGVYAVVILDSLEFLLFFLCASSVTFWVSLLRFDDTEIVDFYLFKRKHILHGESDLFLA